MATRTGAYALPPAPRAAERYVYDAHVTAVHDGDTIELAVELGFDLVDTITVRLAGCNAREIREPGGVEARDNLRAVLPVGARVLVRTIRPDKFGGRYDAAVALPPGAGSIDDLVAWLIDEQWAAAWNGRGDKPVPPWPRTVAP